MSRVDRRAFVVGLLAVPLVGCLQPQAPLLPATFLNYGHQKASGDTPVFVVTGGVRP